VLPPGFRCWQVRRRMLPLTRSVLLSDSSLTHCNRRPSRLPLHGVVQSFPKAGRKSPRDYDRELFKARHLVGHFLSPAR
jgi:hypothetical protein